MDSGEGYGEEDGELWLCQLVVSTQLFWSPIVTEMYCMIADWGWRVVVLYALYEHSILYNLS